MTKSDAMLMKTELKRILRPYRVMTAVIKRKLNALGFSVKPAGKHIKIYYGNDKNHWVLIASTASDVKAGINTVREIFQILIVPQIS